MPTEKGRDLEKFPLAIRLQSGVSSPKSTDRCQKKTVLHRRRATIVEPQLAVHLYDRWAGLPAKQPCLEIPVCSPPKAPVRGLSDEMPLIMRVAVKVEGARRRTNKIEAAYAQEAPSAPATTFVGVLDRFESAGPWRHGKRLTGKLGFPNRSGADFELAGIGMTGGRLSTWKYQASRL